jgi:hypothetical protein
MATPLDTIRDTIRQSLTGAISDNAGTFADAAKAGGDEAGKTVQSTFGGGFGISDVLGLVGLGTGGFGTLGELFVTAAGKVSEYVAAIASGWALGEFFSEAFRPVWLEITHGINNLLQTEIFDPQTAAGLEAKGIIKNDYGRSEAAGGNLSGEHYDKLVQAALTYPGLAVLLDLDNRGVISDGDVTAALERQGYPDNWINFMLQLKANLLSPADLALGNLRGTIPDADMYAYGARLGVSDADMKQLVDNTGEPPGIMELLEALRRGFIQPEDLRRGVRQSRVRDEWYETIFKLRYTPMSTSDAVRANVQSYLTDDQLRDIADQNGLEPDQWRILQESWGRPLSRTEMASLVHRGLASYDQGPESFVQAMRESDVKDKYIQKAFDSATRLVNERQIVSAIRYGAVPLKDGAKMLLQLGFDQDGVAVLLKLGLREAAGPAHALTRAQIVTLYSDGILKPADAMSHLTALGFSDQDA